jgi:hypothetical protein
MFHLRCRLKNIGHASVAGHQIAVQSGEARNHLVGDDAIGFASFRRELIEIRPRTDQDRRLRLFGHQP